VSEQEPDPGEMNTLLSRILVGVNGQAFRLFGNRVKAGPFAGMIIPERTPHWDDGNSGSKLIGHYEFELHPILDYAFWRKPKVIVNVGCGEGYYAIGLARMGFPVLAFDRSPEALELCREYANLNDVDVVLRLGCVNPEELSLQDVVGHRLYVVDCEGHELELIDPGRCPQLVGSDIIVECHDFLRYGASTEIADRLAKTHRVDLVRPRLPDLEQFRSVLSDTPTVMSLLMVVEKRPMPCYWLACWAHQKGNYDG